MDKKIMYWILDVQDAALEDKQYMRLYEEYKAVNERLLALLEVLSENQRTVILDYIRISVEMYHRIMEIACDK